MTNTFHTISTIFNRRSALGYAAVAGVALSLGSPVASALTMQVETRLGVGWLATDTAPSSDWTSAGYDTSRWIEPTLLTGLEAISPPQSLIPGTTARQLWLGNSDGTGSPNEIWMRLEFGIGSIDAGQVLNALARVQVDDDYQLFVNGISAILNNDQGYADKVQYASFGSLLLADNQNVIAIHAVDGGWGNPSDRSYQDVLMDLTISSDPISVPEPTTLSLLVMGLLFHTRQWAARARIQVGKVG